MDVTMPQLGETVAEAVVTRWLKDVGDTVAEGDPLFEVSTDKADMEIPSSADGVLERILVEVDCTVPVGSVLAVIGRRQPAGSDGRPPDAPDADPADRHRLTPLVRRLVGELGLEVGDIRGTGPHGRITRGDVIAAADAAKPRAGDAPVDAPAARPPVVPQPPVPVGGPPAASAAARAELAPGLTLDDVTVVPFSTIRRRTAEHMVRSKATSAHTLMVVDVDYSAVDRVRSTVAAAWRAAEGSGLTYLPFVTRAVVDAIAEFPHLNASVGEDRLLVHKDVNLGIAVDLDGDGLVVPVVRGADGKRLRALAREITGLARTARERRSRPDDFAGGTFTISNPGPYGTLLTAAVINQPQVAILATDAVVPRPVAVEVPGGGHAVVVRPVGNLALSFDHRAIDGGYAARFLRAVKQHLEFRDWTVEL